MQEHLPQTSSVSGTIVKARSLEDYERDVGIWLDAVRGACRQFAWDAHRPSRDAGLVAVQKAWDELNKALGNLAAAVQKEEIE